MARTYRPRLGTTFGIKRSTYHAPRTAMARTTVITGLWPHEFRVGSLVRELKSIRTVVHGMPAYQGYAGHPCRVHGYVRTGDYHHSRISCKELVSPPKHFIQLPVRPQGQGGRNVSEGGSYTYISRGVVKRMSHGLVPDRDYRHAQQSRRRLQRAARYEVELRQYIPRVRSHHM